MATLTKSRTKQSTSINKIGVLLVDNHKLFRGGIKSLLKSFKDIAIIGEANNGEKAIDLVASLSPDIVVMDITMSNMDGLEATKKIKESYPNTKVLILSMHDEEEYISTSIKNGADGYILKDSEEEEFITAIRTVAKGEQYYTPSVSKIMVKGYIRKMTKKTVKQNQAGLSLSNREIEILILIAEGLSNAKIAAKLFISTRTVDTHRNNIMRKLDLHNLSQLIKYAIKHALVEV